MPIRAEVAHKSPRRKWWGSLGLILLLGACHKAPVPHHRDHGPPVLRAVYRDGQRTLLVALALPGGPVPHGDCAAPLLIEANGAVRQVSRAQAAQAMAHMQLAGATPGTCDK